MLVTFPSSVAGVGQPHQARGKLVRHVALQNALLDQHGVLGGIALVVHVKRAAPLIQRAVIHHRTFFAGHAFADKSRKCGGLFAIEIGF